VAFSDDGAILVTLKPLRACWTIYLSNEVVRTEEGKSFEVGGVPPDIAAPVFAPNDIAAGRDPALAAALNQLALTSQ
jgi:C-terminal processing protease CtpA/Prc